jgi:acyl-CoA synthetase (AMP-forming)/AMP-acid ligase II
MPDARLPYAFRSVPEAIAWWAVQTPQAPALLPGDGAPVTYAEFHRRTATLSGELIRAGIKPGDLIAIDPVPRVDSIVAVVGAMRIGAALPLSPGASEAELGGLMGALRPALCLVGRRDSPAVMAAHTAGVPMLEMAHEGGAADPADMPKNVVRSSEATALVLHSSGTTGKPRGIPRTHCNLSSAVPAYVAWVGKDALARVLLTTPLTFGMGAHGMSATFSAGGAVILPEAVPDAILGAVDRWRPTWGYVAVALLDAVLTKAEESGVSAPPGMRALSVSGMAPSSTLAERVAAVFGAPLLEGYGSGETGLIAGSSAGRFSPGVLDRVYVDAIATVDAHGAPTAPGTPGEIVVQGPQVSSAYLGDPEATAQSFVSADTFRTGDIGTLDDDGTLRLAGRIKEIINRGGEKFAPAEIDATLLTHPAVAEAASFSLPDRRLGEEVAAAVVRRPGTDITERDLRRYAARRLAPAKVPRRIWFVDVLPRTVTGKVRRGELAKRFGSARCAEPAG